MLNFFYSSLFLVFLATYKLKIQMYIHIFYIAFLYYLLKSIWWIICLVKVKVGSKIIMYCNINGSFPTSPVAWKPWCCIPYIISLWYIVCDRDATFNMGISIIHWASSKWNFSEWKKVIFVWIFGVKNINLTYF